MAIFVHLINLIHTVPERNHVANTSHFMDAALIPMVSVVMMARVYLMEENAEILNKFLIYMFCALYKITKYI